MGKTYTTFNNKLNVKVFNYKFVKGETWFKFQTNLNRGLPKDKRARI